MMDSKVVKISREWAMPSPEPFSIKPISNLLDRWIKPNTVIIDPFARNSNRGTITNDLDPNTSAQHHMDAISFCEYLVQSEVKADIVLFDPPYSPRQISECYKGIGKKVTMKDTQSANLYSTCKNWLSQVIKPEGIAISFGWNSCGFGKKRGFEQKEILLVCHGGAHNDTIVVVESKLQV